jgi:hypothetical protein
VEHKEARQLPVHTRTSACESNSTQQQISKGGNQWYAGRLSDVVIHDSQHNQYTCQLVYGHTISDPHCRYLTVQVPAQLHTHQSPQLL